MKTQSVRLEIAEDERSELVRYARGRRLVVDYFSGFFGCGGIAAGDVLLRWENERSRVADRLVPASGLEPVPTFVRPEIVPVMAKGAFRLAIRGRGPFRKPVLLLVNPLVWLEFLGNVPARS